MADDAAKRPHGRSAAPQLQLDGLLDDLQAQVGRVRATRDQMHTLLDAVLPSAATWTWMRCCAGSPSPR